MTSIPRIARALMAAIALALGSECAFAENFSEVQPSPQQVAWQDLEFGVIVHFGTNTFLDREWGDGTADPKVFNPDHVDPAQWAAAAKSAGARYLVMVAKHHDGFCLWPTGETLYSVRSSPWLHGKGDLVKLAGQASRDAGLQFGVYLSPWDRHDPRYRDSAAYDQYYLAELTELAGNYGPLAEWWLDGAGSAGHVYNFDRYLEVLRTYQPNVNVFADVGLFNYGDIRWVGNELGHVEGENWNVIDRHGQLRWRPAEVDTPLHKLYWFWHPGPAYQQALKSVPELLATWEQSVGRGSQLMLGLAPDRHGRLPPEDVARLHAFGVALQQRYGNAANLALGHAAASDTNVQAAVDNDPRTFWSAPSGSASAILSLDLGKPVRFDHMLAMERLDAGQAIHAYALQALVDGQWRTISQAQAIGHMKIDAFPAVTAQHVRLWIQSSVGTAQIRELKLFNVGSGTGQGS